MPLPRIPRLLIAGFVLSGCAGPPPSQSPANWTTGFWFWQGSSADVARPAGPLDVLFVETATISNQGGRWNAHATLPDRLPAAREYWFVFRYERQGMPDAAAAPVIAGEVSQLRAIAGRKHLNVIGVQLDIDSPTAALAEYARFLREFKKDLPQGLQISITALLDWFRSGTAVAAVINEVDEFVPQFYDLADPPSYNGGTAIAARIDAARWGPVFNRFRKRFRVGVSTFGRARLVPKEVPPGARYLRVATYGDLTPIDVAANPAFQLQAEHNGAGELVLTYRTTRKTRIGYERFAAGDAIQFVLPTPETVRCNLSWTTIGISPASASSGTRSRFV